jgi:hypothetical protein
MSSLIICILQQILRERSNQGKEMRYTSTNARDEKFIQILIWKLEGKILLGDRGIDGQLILKSSLEKKDVAM